MHLNMRFLHRATAAATFAIALLSVYCLPVWAAEQPERVSLIRLLAEPDKYDGQLLQVAGYFVYEEENHALYLSPDDADNGISNGGIELGSFSGPVFDPIKLQSLNRKYVSFAGVFHARAGSEWPVKREIEITVLAFTEIRGIRSPPYHYCPPDCH